MDLFGHNGTPLFSDTSVQPEQTPELMREMLYECMREVTMSITSAKRPAVESAGGAGAPSAARRRVTLTPPGGSRHGLLVLHATQIRSVRLLYMEEGSGKARYLQQTFQAVITIAVTAYSVSTSWG